MPPQRCATTASPLPPMRSAHLPYTLDQIIRGWLR
jgi:hypothetical protein